jgi:hypothetical protein
MAFEAMTVRKLESVVCGICEICPEICLGDGNEKNCCSNSQVVNKAQLKISMHACNKTFSSPYIIYD